MVGVVVVIECCCFGMKLLCSLVDILSIVFVIVGGILVDSSFCCMLLFVICFMSILCLSLCVRILVIFD